MWDEIWKAILGSIIVSLGGWLYGVWQGWWGGIPREKRTKWVIIFGGFSLAALGAGVYGFRDTICSEGGQQFPCSILRPAPAVVVVAPPAPPVQAKAEPPRAQPKTTDDTPAASLQTVGFPLQRKQIDIILEGVNTVDGRKGPKVNTVEDASIFHGWLCKGDTILAVNGQPLTNSQTADFKDLLVKIAPGGFEIEFAPTHDRKLLLKHGGNTARLSSAKLKSSKQGNRSCFGE
jgi:hypothetical protein